MPRPDQIESPIIENPIQRERVRFLKTVPETNGELVQFEAWLAPGGNVGVSHIHPLQESHFMVLDGRASFRVAGKDVELGPGEVLTVPARTPHYLWNARDVEAHLVIEFRPGLLMQEYYETAFGLARDGKDNLRGIANLLQGAVMTAAYRHEARLLNQPRGLRPVLLLLAPLGWLLGYRAHYARYCTRPTRPTDE